MDDKYLIGNIADYFGVSRDTIRHYDKLGILSPRKSHENNYRYYSREDFMALTYVFLLRHMDIPLDEIKCMMFDATLEKALEIMLAQEKKILKQISNLNELLKYVKDYQECFQNAMDYTSVFVTRESPAFLIKRTENFNGSFMNTLNEFDEMKFCRAPRFTLIFEHSQIMTYTLDKENHKEDWQVLGLSGQVSDSYSLSNEQIYNGFELFEPQKCVFTVQKLHQGVDYSDMSRLREYLEQNNLKAKNFGIFRNISFGNGCGRHIDYYDGWIPIL